MHYFPNNRSKSVRTWGKKKNKMPSRKREIKKAFCLPPSHSAGCEKSASSSKPNGAVANADYHVNGGVFNPCFSFQGPRLRCFNLWPFQGVFPFKTHRVAKRWNVHYVRVCFLCLFANIHLFFLIFIFSSFNVSSFWWYLVHHLLLHSCVTHTEYVRAHPSEVARCSLKCFALFSPRGHVRACRLVTDMMRLNVSYKRSAISR